MRPSSRSSWTAISPRGLGGVTRSLPFQLAAVTDHPSRTPGSFLSPKRAIHNLVVTAVALFATGCGGGLPVEDLAAAHLQESGMTLSADQLECDRAGVTEFAGERERMYLCYAAVKTDDTTIRVGGILCAVVVEGKLYAIAEGDLIDCPEP